MINEIVTRSLTAAQVQEVAKLHMTMVHIMATYNKVFSLQLAQVVASSTLNSVFGLFELYILLKEPLDVYQAFYCIVAFLINISFTAMLVSLFAASTMTMNEGKRTLAKVHEGIYGCKGRKLKRFQILLIQLQHNNAEVSCGFFRFDWKLLMTVS